MDARPNNTLFVRQPFDDYGTAFGVRSSECDRSFADDGIPLEYPHARCVRFIVSKNSAQRHRHPTGGGSIFYDDTGLYVHARRQSFVGLSGKGQPH